MGSFVGGKSVDITKMHGITIKKCVSDVTKLWSRCTEPELLNGEHKMLISFRINAIILKVLA
jgi:hypothetical protein